MPSLPFRAALVLAVSTTPAACQQASGDALPDCEWCGTAEAPATLTSEARLAPVGEPGTPLIVEGTLLEADGRTPAAGVVLYAYHTDATGAYPQRPGLTGNGRRHGALRGWLRTDARGRFRLVTIRPAPYTSRTDPAHIHFTAQAPGREERWLEELLFADDDLLTPAQRAAHARGEAPHIVTVRAASGDTVAAAVTLSLPR